VGLQDRQRLEARWFPEGLRWRYRNQLSVRLPVGAVAPFLTEEVLIPLSPTSRPSWSGCAAEARPAWATLMAG
jgi:hypothetical protein